MKKSFKRTSSYGSIDGGLANCGLDNGSIGTSSSSTTTSATVSSFCEQQLGPCTKSLKSHHHHHNHNPYNYNNSHNTHSSNYALLAPMSVASHQSSSSSSSFVGSPPASSSSSSSSPHSPAIIKRESSIAPSNIELAAPLPPPPLPPPPLVGLPPNCSNKYLEDWLVRNRFGNLVPLFGCYTSNDVLRLSKDDLVKLCGVPDGIRLFNHAHNIQIKPKLSIFVTFSNVERNTFFSAVFLAESKSEFLVRKIIAAYFSSFVKTRPRRADAAAAATTNNQETETQTLVSENNNNEGFHNEGLYAELMNSSNEYELFLRVHGVLVKTNEELLNNLQDQSKFLVTFEVPNHESSSVNPTATSSSATGTSSEPPSKSKLIKIIMIPIE